MSITIAPPPTVTPSPPVSDLCAAADAVAAQVVKGGLGSTLSADVPSIAAVIVRLQVQLARRMAAWQQDDATADPVDAAVSAGFDAKTAHRLRKAARFVTHHSALEAEWLAGRITASQVCIVANGTRRLTPGAAAVVIRSLAPALAGMTQAETRTAVEAAVDMAAPSDPQQRERTDYEARRLVWTGTGGGIEINGYLPAIEAGAFTTAIHALAEQLRAEGDGLTLAQRRADALAALVARASAQGLPAGGGLPAAVTLTISATEAERIAAQQPAEDRNERRAVGSATTDCGGAIGDAGVRFALCCAPITPVHHHAPAATGSVIDRIARTAIAPLHLGRAVRLATAAQRKALQLRDGGCITPGCQTEAAFTQPHHVTPWSLDGPTDLENLVCLCWVHHRQVELGTWRLERLPPGSPRPWRAVRRQ